MVPLAARVEGKASWEEFTTTMNAWFGPSSYLDSELTKIRQRGLVAEYQERFEELNNMMGGL